MRNDVLLAVTCDIIYCPFARCSLLRAFAKSTRALIVTVLNRSGITVPVCVRVRVPRRGHNSSLLDGTVTFLSPRLDFVRYLCHPFPRWNIHPARVFSPPLADRYSLT